MKKDIQFLPVEHVCMAIVKSEDAALWQVYIINRNKKEIETILATSKGYGQHNGQKQETSLLRHSIPSVSSGSYALVESISHDVFHLTNEYWVSFYIENQIFDKKYIFLPDSIQEDNVVMISELNLPGILHQ